MTNDSVLRGKTNAELDALLVEARAIISEGSVCLRASFNGTVQVIRRIEREQARRRRGSK